MPTAFNYAARSDVGMVRKNNQDSGYAGPHLLVVADGMGGHAGGDLASASVIAELFDLDDVGIEKLVVQEVGGLRLEEHLGSLEHLVALHGHPPQPRHEQPADGLPRAVLGHAQGGRLVELVRPDHARQDPRAVGLPGELPARAVLEPGVAAATGMAASA